MSTRILVAQLGARMHYAIPRMLHEAGMLEHFYTDICAVRGWPQLLNFLPSNLRTASVKRLLGRVPKGVPKEKVTAFTGLGWEYQKARKTGTSAAHLAFGTKFCEAVVARGFGNATATYTFNSAGLELMRVAKRKGLKTVMEQTSAPRSIMDSIYNEAISKFPAWANNFPSKQDVDRFVEREEKEWECADLILCGSEFVRMGINQRSGPIEKCHTLPYGVDNRFQVERTTRKPGALRVLTVGQVSLLKGSPVIWQAAELLGVQANFRMVGHLNMPEKLKDQKPGNLVLFGSVPRSEIVKHYEWADVFLLPSLSEGSATVTYEAMMAGLPVICTENTGSIVEDGVSGWIVPILDPDAVAECICPLAADPEKLVSFSKAAIQRSRLATLDAYRDRLLTALAGVGG